MVISQKAHENKANYVQESGLIIYSKSLKTCKTQNKYILI